MVRFDNPNLYIEFEKWSWSNFKKQIHEVEISIAELESVVFKKSMIGTRLILHGRSMRVFETLPTETAGELRLAFKRKHREAAERLASHLRLTLSELRLSEMDEPNMLDE